MQQNINEPQAQFKIHDLFHISLRKSTIIVGEIIEGTISNGMHFYMGKEKIIIDSIEHVDGKLNGEWISRIGLRVMLDDKIKEQLAVPEWIGIVLDVNL